jgi:hypothetical protein
MGNSSFTISSTLTEMAPQKLKLKMLWSTNCTCRHYRNCIILHCCFSLNFAEWQKKKKRMLRMNWKACQVSLVIGLNLSAISKENAITGTQKHPRFHLYPWMYLVLLLLLFYYFAFYGEEGVLGIGPRVVGMCLPQSPQVSHLYFTSHFPNSLTLPLGPDMRKWHLWWTTWFDLNSLLTSSH